MKPFARSPPSPLRACWSGRPSDGRDPDRALPLLHEPLLPHRVGREGGAACAFHMQDGGAERDESVGHVEVGRLRGARVVATREGHETEIHVERDACSRTRGDADAHRFVGPRLVAHEPHRSQRGARVDFDDLARRDIRGRSCQI